MADRALAQRPYSIGQAEVIQVQLIWAIQRNGSQITETWGG
jgi:hypothetical protein